MERGGGNLEGERLAILRCYYQQMMKIQQIVSALIICLLIEVATAAADSQRPTEPVKIGVILPLSGGASSNGVAIKNSILMADKQFDRQDQVQFIFEDNHFQPRQTVTAFKKLTEIDKIRGLIVFGSPTSLSVNSLAETKKVPMIGLSIVDRVSRDKQYVMKHWVPSRIENSLLVSEVKKRGYDSVAIVSTTNDAMLSLRDHFLESRVSRVVLNQEFSPDQTDFRAIVAKIKHLNPDAVYVLLWAPQPGVFIKLLRESKYRGEIFGAHNLEDPDEVEAARGSMYGSWYVTGNDRDATEYYQSYQRQYGKIPAVGGINGYDTAKLFIEAARSGDINDSLHKVKNFTGAYGSYSATALNDFTISAAIKVIKRDGFHFLR